MIAETEEKIKKLEGEASAIKVREELQKIVAPRNGQITKLKNVGPGHMIKEGDTLATLVPPQQSLGVELYVKGLDTPLVEVGRPVRLMFEGFPAVPFVGWPWASVGAASGVALGGLTKGMPGCGQQDACSLNADLGGTNACVGSGQD